MDTHFPRKLRINSRLILSLVIYLLVFGVLLSKILDSSFLVKGESEGWQVDVYTQKNPYNGLGPGEPSDSFAPQQTVTLYANVTYNMGPAKNEHVSFSVLGPPNSVQNYTMPLSAVTDDSGLAETNFTLPWPTEDPETATFGLWNVTACAKNASDYLFFKVGWIIELASLQLLDFDPPQGGWIEARVSLTNLAFTSRNATLAFISSDSSGRIVNTQINEAIEVRTEDANFTTRIQIPLWAAPGTATVNVSAYAPEGDPYSPTILTADFLIYLLGDINGDHQVNMEDLGTASLAYGSCTKDERWNPLTDLNKDGKIDIMDIVILIKNFGRSY